MVWFHPTCGVWEICAENRQEMPIGGQKLWKCWRMPRSQTWGTPRDIVGRSDDVIAVVMVMSSYNRAPRAVWWGPCHRLGSFLVLDSRRDGALYWECVLGGSFIEPTPVKPGPALSSDVTP